MRARLVLYWLCALILSACEGWPAGPYSYKPATPAPTRTPRIQTATPVVLSPTPEIETPTATAETATPTITPASATPTIFVTASPSPSLKINILGCDTGVDLVHGMGEVTNAYVTIGNATAADLSNVCATLRGLDEARPHPDKTKCIPSLPIGYQVTLKLTVDTTYKADTPIQVDVSSEGSLLARSGEPACTAIGLLLPDMSDLGVPKPMP